MTNSIQKHSLKKVSYISHKEYRNQNCLIILGLNLEMIKIIIPNEWDTPKAINLMSFFD